MRLALALAGLFLATPFAQEPARQTFRASTRLVTVDALVHGRNGEPVAGLTAADFRLFEDGKEQRIEFFDVVAAQPVSSSPNTRAPEPIPARGTFTNRPAGAVPSAATIVLFDRLNSRFEDQLTARAEIIKFLGQVTTEQRVALYVLESDAIRVLHDFTDDTASLVRTMAQYRARTSVEQAATDEPVPQFAPVGVASIDAETLAWLRETTETVSAEFTRRRAQITYAAFEAIATHLAGIPGRKNLVWISSAFPLVISDRLGPQTMSRELTQAIQAVNSSHLSIYPIDLRGLVAPYSGPSATATYQATGRGAARPPEPSVSTMVAANTDTMTELAERTGGRAFFNTNGIGRAIVRAIDDARVTYLLGYYPSNDKTDGTFRKLKVTVRAPDTEVRHRTGYLALPASAGRSNQRLTDLARAALESTGVGLTVANDNGALRIHVDPQTITVSPSGGMWDATLDILIGETLPTGEFVKHLERTLNLRLTREQRDDLLREGFSMTRTIDRRSSSSRLHVVVRDTPSGIAGSVTIKPAT